MRIIKYILYFILIINFTGCIYYGYSVKTSELKIKKYKLHKHFSNTKENQFLINVFSADGIDINVYHMSYDRYKKMYLSYVEIQGLYENNNIKLEIESIDIFHNYINGLKIQEIEVNRPNKRIFEINTQNEFSQVYFRKFYSKDIKEQSLIEKIKIVFKINDKQYIIEDSFIIYRNYEYSYFDVLMSV